MSRELVL